MRRWRRGRVVVAVVLVFVLAACGADPGPTEASPSVVERLACLSVEAGQCADIAEAIAERYRDVGVVALLTVGSFCQRNPCDLMRLPQPSGYILVELTGPPRIEGVSLEVAPGGEITLADSVPQPAAIIQPASPRDGPGPSAIDLGHCGLQSPIDYDGSLWDPVGEIDGNAPEAIGAAQGQIVLVAGERARFQSIGGFTVDLLRRIGPKAYVMCD